MSGTQSTADWASSRADEPVLDIDQIQGNIIPGFNKDFQALLFLKIENTEAFKRWLKALAPRITTMREVLDFRRSLSPEERRGKPPKGKKTWVNVAFSHTALRKLGALKDGNFFKDKAFREGLKNRSKSLGEPQDGREGAPRTWVVGGPDNEADVILIVASEDSGDLSTEVTRIKDSISSGGKTDRSGVQIIGEQPGANLPEPLAGHEHFGFRDGISQPGVRGRISNNKPLSKGDYLTPCQNPTDPNQGKPGQDLLWPGEFVFGYPGQDAKKKVEEPGGVSDAGPSWAKNGSFLVFRRLRQDVSVFHNFLHNEAAKYGLTPDHFGAMCVGRWASGAPLLRAPVTDDQNLGGDECANNHFEFQKQSNPILLSAKKADSDCTDVKFVPSPGDPPGSICPFAAHIRRTNPRDDMNNKNEVQTHRLLRRGIPYGEPSRSSPAAPFQDAVDRGLLFLSYQTSIENQFEFIQKRANNSYFKDAEAGYDPIIGQNNDGNPRKFRVTFKNGQSKLVDLPIAGWVTPTGGGYFFAPSIDALKMLVEAR